MRRQWLGYIVNLTPGLQKRQGVVLCDGEQLACGCFSFPFVALLILFSLVTLHDIIRDPLTVTQLDGHTSEIT